MKAVARPVRRIDPHDPVTQLFSDKLNETVSYLFQIGLDPVADYRNRNSATNCVSL
jgi:hypothetical protein